MAAELATIEREFGEHRIRQREADGYLDATAMCKAIGKPWAEYSRSKGAKEFLALLSIDIANFHIDAGPGSQGWQGCRWEKGQ